MGVVATYTIAEHSATYVEFVASAPLILGFVFIPVALMVDSFVYGLFKTTPGKAILGMRLATIHGESLTFKQAAKRNLGLWVRGLGIGLPLVYFFTLLREYNRLGSGKQTDYDEKYDFRVQAKPTGWPRKSVFALLFIGLFSVMLLGQMRVQKMHYSYLAAMNSPNYDWVNPETGKEASVVPTWSYKSTKNADGETVYMFTGQGGHAIVIFADEYMPKYDVAMTAFAKAFEDKNAKAMSLDGGGSFSTVGGVDTWDVSGAMTGTGKNRLHIEARKINRNFWRIVVIQVPPYDYTQNKVVDLSRSLWATVPQ